MRRFCFLSITLNFKLLRQRVAVWLLETKKEFHEMPCARNKVIDSGPRQTSHHSRKEAASCRKLLHKGEGSSSMSKKKRKSREKTLVTPSCMPKACAWEKRAFARTTNNTEIRSRGQRWRIRWKNKAHRWSKGITVYDISFSKTISGQHSDCAHSTIPFVGVGEPSLPRTRRRRFGCRAVKGFEVSPKSQQSMREWPTSDSFGNFH